MLETLCFKHKMVYRSICALWWV